jgi:predicted N-acetyltransferase YhbS
VEIFNLKDRPQYIKDATSLIESSFGYDSNNQFAVDFYPLMNENNHQHCHVLIKDEKVMAHVGVLPKKIRCNDQEFTLHFYGGIAVAEEARGKGLFKSLFNNVLKEYKQCSFHLLWSEKIELYHKFNFYPAIDQMEYAQEGNSVKGFIKTQFNQLTENEKNQVQSLYEKLPYLKIYRSENDWNILAAITSSDLYIKKEDDDIIDYFFINKGADLQGIIHEHSPLDSDKLKKLQAYGKVWTPRPIGKEVCMPLFAALIKPGKQFDQFIKSYIPEMTINKINHESIEFHYGEEEIYLPLSEFLTGVFGPGRFDELQELPPLFISGMDSI